MMQQGVRVSLVVLAVLLGACQKPEAPAPVKQEQPAKQITGAKPGPGAAGLAELSKAEGLEQACGTLHDVMKKRVERIKQRRGPRPEDKAFPSKETFISGCKALPPAAMRCMIPDIVRQNRAACAGYFKGMMGKEEAAKVQAFRATLL